MNKELIERLTTDAINEIVAIIKGTKDFVLEQAPLVVQEILYWGLAKHGALLIIGLLTAPIFGYCILWFRRNAKWVFEEEWTPFGILGVFGLFLLSCKLLVDGFIIVKIYLAPRLYLLEKLRELL